jgi:putative transposase
MARHDRPNIAGGMYHVMNRGNRKQSIFDDDRDRRRLLRIVREECEIHDVRILAGTLMGNHFHMGVATPRGNLSEFMQQVEGRFARYSNWRHGRVGHLFQGRFRHVLLEHDVHLLAALCYIFMNPVAAGLATKLEDYQWSSYAATAGFKPIPDYLTIDWLEALFPGVSLQSAKTRLRQIMATRRPVAAYLEDRELNVSAETVRQVIRSYTGEQLQLASLPQRYREELRPSLDQLHEQFRDDRRGFIWEARVECGYKYAEIAKRLGRHESTVSRAFRSAMVSGHRALFGIAPDSRDRSPIGSRLVSGTKPGYQPD